MVSWLHLSSCIIVIISLINSQKITFIDVHRRKEKTANIGDAI